MLHPCITDKKALFTVNNAVIDIAEYKGIEPTNENIAKLKQDLIEQKLLNAES